MTRKTRLQLYGPFIFLILITASWILLFRYTSPEQIVERLGVQNTYVLAFIMAILGGFSSFTGSTFYLLIGTLAYGGANPLLLGLIGGTGLCISDSLFYYIITKGRHVVDHHWTKLSTWIKDKLSRAPSWVINSFVFIYSGFLPIPNDVMTATLAIGGTPFMKIAPYLFAGDIVSTVLLAYLAQ